MSRYPHEITIVNNQAKSLSKVQNQKSKRKKHMYKTRKDSWHISNENEWSKLNRYAKIVRRLGSPVQRVYLVPCHVTKKNNVTFILLSKFNLITLFEFCFNCVNRSSKIYKIYCIKPFCVIMRIFFKIWRYQLLLPGLYFPLNF